MGSEDRTIEYTENAGTSSVLTLSARDAENGDWPGSADVHWRRTPEGNPVSWNLDAADDGDHASFSISPGRRAQLQYESPDYRELCRARWRQRTVYEVTVRAIRQSLQHRRPPRPSHRKDGEWSRMTNEEEPGRVTLHR